MSSFITASGIIELNEKTGERMKVLVVYSHPNPRSFCHAVLEAFTRGLEDGEHTFEVVDLYAIKFDPCIKLEDFVQFTGGQMPQDVLSQQEKLSQADALAFIYPAYGWSRPAILEGWLQRVFSYGFAYKWGEKGYEGLLRPKKALLINTTANSERDWKTSGVEDATKKVIDTSLKMCGIQRAEHVFLYAVSSVDDETRKEYLQTAYRLGKEF